MFETDVVAKVDVNSDLDIDVELDVDVDVDKSFLECVTLLTAGSSSGTIISQERRRSGANKLEEMDAPCFVSPAKKHHFPHHHKGRFPEKKLPFFWILSKLGGRALPKFFVTFS